MYFEMYEATFTPIITNKAIINVSIPALKLISFITNAESKSVITARLKAASNPYREYIITIATMKGIAIILPTIASLIKSTSVYFAITLVIPAILGHKIKNANANAAISSFIVFPLLLFLSTSKLLG